MGMKILRVMGCMTKRAAEMLPTQAIHSLNDVGRILTKATEKVQTKSGTQNHSW